MTRLLKCYGFCNEKHKKENLIKDGGKNYCENCLSVIKKDREDRELLYKTIKIVYNLPYPNGRMLKQISEYKNDRGYSYEDINKTICYFVKILKKIPTIDAGVAFVPWYIERAVSYYNDLDRRRQEMKNIEVNNKKVLKLKTYSTVDTREPIVNKRFIKMGDILNDG